MKLKTSQWWIYFLQTCSFSLLKMLTDGLEWCVMVLSAVMTLILTAPIHCRGSTGEQVMECYISLNLFWWGNKLIYILDVLSVNIYFIQIWHLLWTLWEVLGSDACLIFLHFTASSLSSSFKLKVTQALCLGNSASLCIGKHVRGEYPGFVRDSWVSGGLGEECDPLKLLLAGGTERIKPWPLGSSTGGFSHSLCHWLVE